MGLLFCFIWYLVPSVCLQKTCSTLTLFLCFQNAPIKCINLDKIDKWLALRVQDLLCILRSVQCQGTRCDGSIRCIPFRSGSGSKVFRVELEVVGIKQCLGLFAELWLRQVHVQQRLLDNQCPISKRNASLVFCIPLRRTLLLKLRNSLFEGWEAWQLQLLLPRHGEYLLANHSELTNWPSGRVCVIVATATFLPAFHDAWSFPMDKPWFTGRLSNTNWKHWMRKRQDTKRELRQPVHCWPGVVAKKVNQCYRGAVTAQTIHDASNEAKPRAMLLHLLHCREPFTRAATRTWSKCRLVLYDGLDEKACPSGPTCLLHAPLDLKVSKNYLKHVVFFGSNCHELLQICP